jgi:hypothetical protein
MTPTVALFRKTALALALFVPVFLPSAALRAEEHKDARYHDKDHNDDHEWNSREDRAYRIWAKESHRKYREFSKLKEDDQQAYWRWRHDHSDALLKIDIR